MDRIKERCKACNAEHEVKAKPPPKDARERRQIRFNCKACGVVNLRDGTAVFNRNMDKHVKKSGAKTDAPKAQKTEAPRAVKPAPEPKKAEPVKAAPSKGGKDNVEEEEDDGWFGF